MLWIAIPLGIYLLLCGLVFLMQDFLTFPGAGRDTGSVEIPAGVQVRWLERPGGERFRVAESVPAAPRGVLVFFVGNGEALGSAVWWAEDLAQYGLHTLVVEYPGYGESEGTAGIASILEAAETAGDHGAELARELAVPLVVGGSSLGTFCAVHLAAQGRASRMLLKSPPTSLAAVARMRFPWLPVGWLLRHRFDNLGRAEQVHCPVLVVHGDRDQLVPSSMGDELTKAFAGPARFLLVSGHGHNDPSLSSSGPVALEVRTFLGGG